jgi:hypothetical protein
MQLAVLPFNGMFIVGTHRKTRVLRGTTFTLWEWQSGIPLPTMNTTMEESPRSPMNTTNNSNDTSTAAGIITKR